VFFDGRLAHDVFLMSAALGYYVNKFRCVPAVKDRDSNNYRIRTCCSWLHIDKTLDRTEDCGGCPELLTLSKSFIPDQAICNI